MSESETLAIIDHLYTTFLLGDLEAALDLVSDDTVDRLWPRGTSVCGRVQRPKWRKAISPQLKDHRLEVYNR